MKFELVLCSSISVPKMNADHHHPWSINLQAKSKGFNFKFKATRFLPACYNFFQFSIFLKISSLIIRASSDNYNQPARRNSFKSKIKRFIERFRSIPTKRKTASVHKSSGVKKSKAISCEEPRYGGNVVIGNLAMLIQAIYGRDVRGIIVQSFSLLLLYILTLLKTFMRIKNNKLVLISVLLMVGYLLWFYMMNNSIHGRIIFGWRCIRKIWNWAKVAANLGLFG